jgi:arabinofuranan 3-O-arabinosyltransferase
VAEARRDDRGETLKLLARVAPLFALSYAIVWAATLDLSRAIPRDGTTLVVGRDFLNFWMAARASWAPDPQRFYDLATYQAEVASIVGPGYLGQVWSYPPSIMLIAAPFAGLPYLPALALWTVLGPLILFVAIRSWIADRRLQIALLLSPAAVFCLISGQFAFVATAIILNVLRLRQSRAWLAGALLGLLTLKPQLGLFFPVMLLAARDWRVIGGAIASAATIAAATAIAWGVEPWLAYWSLGMPTQSRVLSDAQVLGGPFMPTVFMNLRSAGVAAAVAGWAQAAAALVAAALIAWRFRKQPSADDWSANALFLAAALFGTPYLMSYDTLPLTAAVLLALPAGRTGRLLVLATYFLTLLQLVFGGLHLPGPALIPLALALYLAKQAASSTWVDQRNCPTGFTHSSA